MYKKVNLLFSRSYSLLSGWQKFKSVRESLLLFPRTRYKFWRFIQSLAVLSLLSTQLMAEGSLVPRFFSVLLRLKGNHSTPQSLFWCCVGPAALTLTWPCPPTLAPWAVLPLGSTRGLGTQGSLLSFRKPICGFYCHSHCHPQAKLEETGRVQASFLRSYLLMTLFYYFYLFNLFILFPPQHPEGP